MELSCCCSKVFNYFKKNIPVYKNKNKKYPLFLKKFVCRIYKICDLNFYFEIRYITQSIIVKTRTYIQKGIRIV